MKRRMTAVFMSVILAFGTAAPVMAAEPQGGQEAVSLEEAGASADNSEDSYTGTEKDIESFGEEDVAAEAREKETEEEGAVEEVTEKDAVEEAAEKGVVEEEAAEGQEKENPNTEDIGQTDESASEDIVPDMEESEVSIQVPDMEIKEMGEGESGIFSDEENYDKDQIEALLKHLASSRPEGEEQATAVNGSKIDLYVLADRYKEFLTIPSGFRQSFQLSVTESGPVSYSVQSGNSVTVSSTGLIQPAVTKSVIWNGTENVPNGVIYKYGTSKICVKTASKTYYVTVTVHEYASYYAERVIDAFLKKNITSDMGGYEKLQKIAAFPCNFNYSAKYSDYMEMIVCGGGSCWASSSAILYLCEKVGLQAHVRYGANDSGSGSGHVNVAVKIGDRIYIVEAGYTGNAPRRYHIWESKTGFSYTLNPDNTAKITQYDGFGSNITVPSQIDGYVVTSLGESAFFYGEWTSKVPVNSVVLPKTLTTIENEAFTLCRSLQTITIPASVHKIGDSVFSGCKSLKEINVETGNKNYISRNGVLYDKGISDLLYYPAGKAGAYKVPSGVKTIHKGAFYRTEGIHTLTLPQSVAAVGENAFAESELKKIYFQGNVPQFSNNAFAELSFQGFYPKSNTTWKNKPGNYNAYEITWNPWEPITNFRAASAGKNKVRLSWTRQENVDGYLIYAQKNGKYGYAGMTSGGTAFTDVKALDSDYNFYWVFPYIMDEGKIVDVPGMCGKYVYAKGVCPAVTKLKAASVSGGVNLTWEKSAEAEGYLIYGKTATGKYGYIGMTTKGTAFTDKKASKTEYNFYWVFPYHKDSKGKMIVGGTPKYVYGKAR